MDIPRHHLPPLLPRLQLTSLLASSLFSAVFAQAQELPLLEVTLSTPPGQMKYDLDTLEARPGQKMRIKLDNKDEMPHNLVITKPATDKGLALAQAAWALGEKGMELQWVPQDPRVLAASKMVGPHESGVIEFTTPAEPGEYPYVCTFPGHAMSMNGVLRVSKNGRHFDSLKYRLYLGSWEQLPDFSKLTPHREGELADGKLGWKFDDYKNQFGIVFQGTLQAPTAGKYSFFLTSDDGSRLIIDGKPLAEMDGIHPAGDIKRVQVELSAGPHQVEVAYFQQSGQAELYLGWRGPGFSETPLSTWVPDNRQNKKKDDQLGIPLTPPTNRALIYRNFIEGVSPRGIAVGYPGGTNLCFDADLLVPRLLWRGAFMDAKRHWTNRGGGNQPPLGYDALKLSSAGPGVAILANPQDPWPAAKNALGENRSRDGKFLGYHLNNADYPTFRYQMGDAIISDEFTPPSLGTAPKAAVTRTISITGTPPPNLYVRVADAAVTETAAGTWTIGESYSLQVVGGTPLVRGNREILVPLSSNSKLTLTYAWLQ